MHLHRASHLPLLLAAAAAIALPGAAVAAEAAPVAPPAAVVDWQTHLAHMQAIDGPLGQHVIDCIAQHGSMAGLLGPDGAMVEMMGELVR